MRLCSYKRLVLTDYLQVEVGAEAFYLGIAHFALSDDIVNKVSYRTVGRGKPLVSFMSYQFVKHDVENSLL